MARLVIALALLLAGARLAHAGDGDAWDGDTMARQTGGAFVGGAVVGSLGGALGLGVGAAFAENGNWGAPLAGAGIGFAVGAVVGIVAGVQVVGDNHDGTGSPLATTLGEVAGLATIALYATLRDHLDVNHRPSIVAEALVGLAAIVAGPIVGYQLSN